MGLFNPTPGEIIDRMTILGLKIQHGSQKGMSTTHWEAEKAQCQEGMTQWDGGLGESFYFQDANEFEVHQSKINEQVNALQAVNALLWRAEDEVRATGEHQAFKLARLCKQIAGWNDARAKAIRELNKLYDAGVEPEKLHDSVNK